ncbi:MAG: peptidylprolyl isomerase [Bacteroidota bacterium]
MKYFFFLLLFTSLNAGAQAPDIRILKRKAPESFQVLFKTTKGNFILEAYRRWSPVGVDRLYQLVLTGYYNLNSFFRVEPNYVVQFGISDDFETNYFWHARRLKDEPVLQSHKKGTVAFVRSLANSRATQLFINIKDNPSLDTTVREGIKGFTPIGKVIKGLDVLMKLNGQYGRKVATFQDSIYLHGNAYLFEHYPGLDMILSARIIR